MSVFSFRWTFHIGNGNSPFETHGPLFTHWLPNGEVDAIELPLQLQSGTARLWFERFGFIESDGFITFDYKRKDVGDATIARQGVLDAGPIIGKVILANDVPNNIRTNIALQVKDDSDVISYIKPIVKDINAILILLVDVLKYRFGQYWLPSVAVWDSREYPLGVYCKYHLQLRLLAEDGGSPIEVIPDDISQTVNLQCAVQKDFSEYLSRGDLKNLQANISILGNDLYIEKLLLESFEDYQNSDYKSAIVSACTVIELAIGRYFDYTKVPGQFKKYLAPIQELPLRTQIMTVLLVSSTIEKAPIFCYFVDIRNKIVHEAYVPQSSFDYPFTEFLKEIGKVFLRHDIRLPLSNHGNVLLPVQ